MEPQIFARLIDRDNIKLEEERTIILEQENLVFDATLVLEKKAGVLFVWQM